MIETEERQIARDRAGVLRKAIKAVSLIRQRPKFERKGKSGEEDNEKGRDGGGDGGSADVLASKPSSGQATLNSRNLYMVEHQGDIQALNDLDRGRDMEMNTGMETNQGGVVDGNENDDIEYDISILSDEMSTIGNTSQLFAEPPHEQSYLMSIVVGVFVAVGGFLFGYDTGLINSIVDMRYVKDNISPSHDGFNSKELAIIVSFLSLGTFVGALSAPFISDKYGRKKTIMFSTAIVFSIGNSLQVAAHGINLLIAGRVISGLGVGLVSAVVPLYQAEAAHKSLRGAIISTYQWAITWGLLVSSAVSQGTHNRNDASSYRIPIGLQYVWAYSLAAGMLFLPESPRYYILRDQLDKAAEALAFLRGVPVHDSGLLEELVEIKATFDYEASFGKTTFWDCFRSNKSRPKQTLRMFTGIAIQAFQQFSGINFIFYYGVSFFSRSGIKNSYIVSLITYAVNVGFSVPGLFLVEYIGRRSVLLYGGVIMTISNFIIAIVGSSTQSVVANKVMISFICLFIASFAATWGGVVWVISAELYPLGVRAKCTAICAAANWLINFVCAFMTPYIVDTGERRALIGPKIYFIWGSLNALGLLIVYFTVYETRGLTLEEIDELYSKSPNGIVSAKWNKRIRNRTKTYGHHEQYQQNHQPGQTNTLEKQIPLDTVDGELMSDGLTPRNDSMNSNRNNDFNPANHSSIPIRSSTEGTQYLDFGNEMVLHIVNRGPPSLSTAASIEEFAGGNTPNSDGLPSVRTNTNEDSKDDGYASHTESKKLGLFSRFSRNSSKHSDDSQNPIEKTRSNLKIANTNTFDDQKDFVDLGNGFGLYSISRRLSSGIPDISDDDSEIDLADENPSSSNSYRNQGNLEMINSYMSQLIQSNTVTIHNSDSVVHNSEQ